MQAKKLDGGANGKNICAVPNGFNGLKSVATTWIAPPELQNPFCSNSEGHSNSHYGIEEYKAGQATVFRIFVRRFGLTFECGAPAPLCLAVHWFYPASGQFNSKAAQGRRSPKIAPQSQNTKSCFIALFELIVTVQVDKFTIYR